MRDVIRQDLVVGPGGVIEIRAPDLPVGSVAEVIVRVKKPTRSKRKPRTTPWSTYENPGWPPGFFEQTFGSLRDLPRTREPQGDYETRDEIG